MVVLQATMRPRNVARRPELPSRSSPFWKRRPIAPSSPNARIAGCPTTISSTVAEIAASSSARR
jgi:hypothetical protein